MEIASAAGSRTVPASEFFQGFLTTALEPNELLTSVHFPAAPPTTGSTVVEISRRHGDYAMCGLACSVDVQGGAITAATLSFFGVATVPVRIAEAEATLIGAAPTDDAFAAAADAVTSAIQPTGDVHATAAYRRHIAGVLTRRGLSEATRRIGVPA